MTAKTNYIARLNFGDAMASRANPKQIGETVRNAMTNQDCWAAIEPFALPPGLCGSKSFDQANIVRELKDWDAAHNNGKVAAFGMSDRVLWNYIYRELSKVFQTSHGRVLGLLEDKSKQEDGAPGNGSDIE